MGFVPVKHWSHDVVDQVRRIVRTPVEGHSKLSHEATNVRFSVVDRGSIEFVRQRPGMFFGSTGPSGLRNVVLEVISNSMDQVMAGRADRISVTLGDDGSATVVDNGSGFPVEPDDDGVPFLTRMFTTMHDSPTADGHTPHVHLSDGVGLGAVSAVCLSVEVTTSVGGVGYSQRFCRGHAANDLARSAVAPGWAGTSITLWPDPELFTKLQWDSLGIGERLRTLSFLHPGLNIDYHAAERFGPVVDLSELFRVKELAMGLMTRPGPLLLHAGDGRSGAHLALGWGGSAPPAVRSFCNFRETIEGGAHVRGLEEGFRRVFGAGPVDRLMSGLVGVVHVVLLDPSYSGPTGGRLDNPEALSLVADAIASDLPAYLERPGVATELDSRLAAGDGRSP